MLKTEISIIFESMGRISIQLENSVVVLTENDNSYSKIAKILNISQRTSRKRGIRCAPDDSVLEQKGKPQN